MELSNKGKYAYPKSADDSCKVINADNYYQGEMSCEAAGMGLMLMCYSDFAIKMHQLGREDDCIWFSNLFHKLRDFALGHNESGAILRFID